MIAARLKAKTMSKSPKPEDVAAEISKDGDQGQETSSEK